MQEENPRLTRGLQELTFGCSEFEKESDPWLASEKRLARW
jgi:hypothetical protein